MTPRQARIATDVFTGAMVVSVALALANLTWRLAGEPGTGPVAAPVMARGGTVIDVTQLVALNPFGSALTVPAAGTGDGAVTLKAVFLAFPAEASVVLLGTADGQVASYTVGSAVGGGVIETIAAEQITIRTSGGLQTIGFNPSATAGPLSGQALPAPAPAIAAGGLPPPPPPPTRATGADAIRALIPQAVQGRPAASPGAPSSAGTGYPIGGTVPPALAAAGVRPGDVVQRVNGAVIGPGVNFNDVAARAMASGSAQVELLRDGQRVFMTIPAR